MDKKTEQLRAEIARTKADIREKASEFENRLRDDVTHAKDKVESAIHNVQSVASGLSLKNLVQKKPLLMVGGSVVSGIVVGSLLAPKRRHADQISSHEGSSFAGRVHDRFPDEVRVLKTMAFTYLVNFVADRAKTAFPDLVHKISEFEQHLKANIDNKG